VKVKCFSWLRDTDEGRKYTAKHPELEKVKTRPLLTLGAKGNLLLTKKVQVVDEYIDEAY
jgi:hypothetical protein